MDIKLLFTIVSILLMIGVLSHYCYGILKGVVKPHAYTWLIFSVMNGVTFFIQTANGGGWGSYVFLLNFIGVFLIFLLSLRYGEKNITRSDTFFLAMAGVLVMLWLVLDLPVISTILIICIDFLALLPTFRKSYLKPHEETVVMYFMSGVIFFFSILAIQNYSFLTIGHQSGIIIFDLSLALFILVRRYQLKK